MKNLKRILIAVSILLLVACSVGVIAAAADTYTGTVTGLQNEYKKVERDATNIGKSTKLEAVYAYISDTPVDPEAEGYTELVAKIDASAVTIAQALINDVKGASSVATRIEAYNRLASHVEKCVPTVIGEDWEAVVAEVPTSNVALVEYWVNHINNASVEIAKKSVVDLYAHLETYPIDSVANRELLTNASKAAYNVAQALYEEIVNYDTTAEQFGDTKKMNKINLLQNYVWKVNISAGDTETPKMSAKIAELLKWKEETLEAKRVALDKQANFNSYDWTSYHVLKNFDGKLTAEEYGELTAEEQKEYKAKNDLFDSYNTKETHYSELGYEPNGNGYQALVYGGPGTSHLYIEPQFEDNAMTNGLVAEFDMWLSQDFYHYQFDSREPSNSGAKIVSLFKISGYQGSDRSVPITISAQNSADGVPLESYGSYTGIIERESWFHISLTFDPETRIGKLYLNYEYLFDVAYNANWKFNGLRMSINTNDMEVRYDNFEFYQGTQPRIFDKFIRMDTGDQFEYYVDFMNDDANSSLFRNMAYKKAENLLTTYKEDYNSREQYQTYIDAFGSCDYLNEIKYPAMAENIVLLRGYVDELKLIDVNSENFASLNSAIAKINEFVKVNSELIDKGDTSDTGYQAQMAVVQNVQKGMAKIESAMQFIAALERFSRATTHSSMLKRYAEAKFIFESAKYEDAANVDVVKNDPVVLAFEEKINKDVAEEDKVTAFEYYANIENVILVREMYENSKKLLECYGFITSVEGYESTKECWRKNKEYIAPYASIIRDIVNPGIYDASIEGVDEAIAEFRQMDLYFYELLQKEHIATIKAQLDKYLSTNAYIEKAAICTSLLAYTNEDGVNDLAVYLELSEDGSYEFITNKYLTPEVAKTVEDEIDEIKQLEVAIVVCNEEIALQYEDYIDVLESNTASFLSIITHMNTLVTYEELKPLFDQASVYYYGINIDNEEVLAAAECYDEYRVMLEAYEANGTVFIGLVDELKAATKLTGIAREDALYTAIAKCSVYADQVDTTMDGVSAAMKAYTRIYNEYVAETAATNAVIENTEAVALAGNVKATAASIISVLVGIIKN